MSNNFTESQLNFSGQPEQSEINDTLFNVTNDVPVEYLVVLFGYITPVSFLVTVVVNIIIVLILSRPDMRTPTNQVLMVMAVADLLTLVFPIPWYFYLYTLGNHLHYLHPSLLCNLYYYMSDVLPVYFHTASIWCTLLLACQRYIYICHPSTALIWCTNKRVTRIISAIFLIAFVHQLPQFFVFNYDNVTCNNVTCNNVTISHAPDISNASSSSLNPFQSTTEVSSITTNAWKPACRVRLGEWLNEIETVYFSSYYIFRIIFIHVVPCLTLVIFNVLLYNALKRAELTRARLFVKNSPIALAIDSGSQRSSSNSNGVSNCGDSQHKALHNENISRASISLEIRKSNRGLGRSSGRDANSTTFMLIVVVTVFLIVEIPLAIISALHVTANVFNINLVPYRILNMTTNFCNFFIIISYPLNFAIYCGMSQTFRKTFQQMFIRRIVENTSSNSTTTTTANSTPSKTVKTPQHNIGLNKIHQESEKRSPKAQVSLNHCGINSSTISNADSNNNRSSDHRVTITNGERPDKCCIDKQSTLTDKNGVTKLVVTSVSNSPNSTSNNLYETML